MVLKRRVFYIYFYKSENTAKKPVRFAEVISGLVRDKILILRENF